MLQIPSSAARFPAGRVVATPAAVSALAPHEIQSAFDRHLRGDWGDCSPDDLAANDAALSQGGRLFSVYRTLTGISFLIITEADRSVTTVLLPEDY